METAAQLATHGFVSRQGGLNNVTEACQLMLKSLQYYKNWRSCGGENLRCEKRYFEVPITVALLQVHST